MLPKFTYGTSTGGEGGLFALATINLPLYIENMGKRCLHPAHPKLCVSGSALAIIRIVSVVFELLPLTPHSCQHIDMAIIPNMNSQVLTVFTSQRCASRECCHTEGSSIYYTRFNYGGHILGEGRFHLPDIRGSEIKDVLPVDRCGGYALEVRTCLSKKSEGYPFSAQEGRSLFFDDKANTFKDPRCPIPQSRSVYTVPQEVKWWKDTFYQVRPGKESFPKGYSTTKASETETLLAYMGTRYVRICVFIVHGGRDTDSR